MGGAVGWSWVVCGGDGGGKGGKGGKGGREGEVHTVCLYHVVELQPRQSLSYALVIQFILFCE